MQVAYQVLVFVHLIGFAALLGGVLVQARSPEPEVNVPMLYGAMTGLASGVALWILAGVGPEPAPTAPLVVKTVVGVAVAVLVAANRKYASVPRGLWLLIGGLTLVEAAVAVFWR